MMSHDYAQAYAHIAAVTQCDPDAVVIDARMIHDVRKDVPAIPMRGTLAQLWANICAYNMQGYGAFINVNDMDGNGHHTTNVRACRVHFADLDSLSAQQNLERANVWNPAPQFAVESSPGKYHAYWCVTPYTGNEYFSQIQRKLRQFFDGDKRTVDSARVLRLAGTFHLKDPARPHLVRCFGLNGYGQTLPVTTLDTALANVVVIDGGSGLRHDLGDPALAAPSLEWLQRALDLTDPNMLDRGDWVAVMSSVKQAGWSLTDPETLQAMFMRWCERYDNNDVGENIKQWKSIRNTEVGWPYMVRRLPVLNIERYVPVAPDTATDITIPLPAPPPLDCSGEMLTAPEQAQWFKGYTYIVEMDRVLSPDVQFLKQTQFNAKRGGKIFIISSDGKTTKTAWEAAVTNNTQFKIPQVDHIRFIPTHPFGEIIHDSLGRDGINIYKPALVARVKGDPTPFLRHISFMLPDEGDQKILLDYLAHNIKYPGHKIPWAPVIQSTEGVGKGILKRLMRHCVGNVYFHAPNAKDLAEGGQKFNAWMRAKLFILADEIKVDDRRDMIEVLKPMISEEEIEVQAKGVDQKIEDNFANWMFFTNYKDAVPISKNSRRFCIMYSAFQSKQQLAAWGLNKEYFDKLYAWMKADGAAIMYDYFMDYPIERGSISMNAPESSMYKEVIQHSMGPIERLIVEAVADGVPGFKGGWISSAAVRRRIVDSGMRSLTINVVEKIITDIGYREIGRSVKPYPEEGDMRNRSTLFHLDGDVDVASYGLTQGYA